MEFLWEGVMAITPQQFVMYLIGGLLIWLAVKKEYEPALHRGDTGYYTVAV